MKLDNLSFLALVFFASPAYSADPSEMTFTTASSGIRSMSTDRPDTTESAYSVPAGMFQVEMSFFDFERDAGRGQKTETSTWGQMNIKRGLTDDVDLQVVFDVHQQSRFSSGAGSLRESGFGDVTLRLKNNVWGNDEGPTALAVMPYVSIPTGARLSAEAWQAGVAVPFAWQMTERFNFGMMAQADMVHDEESAGYDLQWLASATVGVALSERWGAFIEGVAVAGEDMPFFALLNGGLTFALTDDCVLDAGLRIGLNRTAPDIGVFSGISFRF